MSGININQQLRDDWPVEMMEAAIRNARVLAQRCREENEEVMPMARNALLRTRRSGRSVRMMAGRWRAVDHLADKPRRGMTTKITPHIRWTIRRDMPEILAIERARFEYPWSEEDFVRVLRNRNCIGMVCEWNDAVVGFMVYELHCNRMHLLNLAVAADWSRLGVGSAMVAKLKSKLNPSRRRTISLEVRESNLPAQLFFRAMGFRAVSVARDFYLGEPPEDAFVMEHTFDRGAEVIERIVGGDARVVHTDSGPTEDELVEP
jgi:ribosomal-protein-alanine N-acetyltransferase